MLGSALVSPSVTWGNHSPDLSRQNLPERAVGSAGLAPGAEESLVALSLLVVTMLFLLQDPAVLGVVAAGSLCAVDDTG